MVYDNPQILWLSPNCDTYHTNKDYGPVIRFDYGLIIFPSDSSSAPPEGEWRPLERSSQLLSVRFGNRGRPYIAHAPKLFSGPLLFEMGRGMWRAAWENTARRIFRGMNLDFWDDNDGSGDGKSKQSGDDVHTGYLFGNYVVERWREALLWSWVVGKIGGTGTEDSWTPPVSSAPTKPSSPIPEHEDEDEEEEEEEEDDDFMHWRSARFDSIDPEDVWTAQAHERRAWYELGGEEDSESIEVELTQRDSLDLRLVDHNLQRTGKDELGTAYTFCEYFTIASMLIKFDTD